MNLARLHLHWRVSHYKGRSYRSYSLARAFREHGKNRREIVVKLGKLSDEEAQRWRELLKALKNPEAFFTTADDITVRSHFAYLDVAVANAVWDSWGLDEVFCGEARRKLSVAKVARILSINRCIDPAAKSQVPEWFSQTALPWLLSVDPEVANSSRIFRELDEIEKHKEALCAHLFEKMRRDDPNSMSCAFYDLSSTTFHGTRCLLVRWGHCKEGFDNHVVLALVVNSKGLPFYWEVLPGNTSDSTTIAWLLSRLEKRFGDGERTVVFDRGMVSDANLALLEEQKIKYITAMDRNQIEPITGLDFGKFGLVLEKVDEQADDLPGFSRTTDGVYFREVKVEGERRYILSFNPQLFKDQHNARAQALSDFRTFVANLNTALADAKNSRQQEPTRKKFQRQLKKVKLEKFVDVKLRPIHLTRTNNDSTTRKVRTYAASVVVDEPKMHHAGWLDGFWLLVTNHFEKDGSAFAKPASAVIAPYRDKVLIESAFRDIKSFVEISPVHVWTEAHVKAHYTICVLAYLINRTITLQLHERRGSITKDTVTHVKLYRELSDCMFDRIEIKNMGLTTHNMTQPTPEQTELVARLGLENLLSHQVVEHTRSAQ